MANPLAAYALRAAKTVAREGFAWPGGYPIYLLMTDGGTLCRACVRSQWEFIARDTIQYERGCDTGWIALDSQINWEDGELYCDHCNKRIESAYAEPETPKPRPLFNVTYEIVTPKSAEHGDAAERGFILENASLRDAIAALGETRTNRVDGVQSIEADESPMRAPRSVTVCNGMEYETGAHESRAIHFPESLTSATRLRLARLLGVKG